jgi:hypothetical protein
MNSRLHGAENTRKYKSARLHHCILHEKHTLNVCKQAPAITGDEVLGSKLTFFAEGKQAVQAV